MQDQTCQHSYSRHQVGPPRDIGNRFNIHRMHGENRGREKSRETLLPDRQGEQPDEHHIGGVQPQIHAMVSGGTVSVAQDGIVKQERKCDQRPVDS